MKQARIEKILLRLKSGQIDVGWAAFLDIYSDVLRRIVRHYETGADTADECYEYICAKLSEGDFRRLKSFDTRGPARFRTWLTAVTANPCTDWRLRIYGRRRLPEIVRNLSEIEQLVFRCRCEQGMIRNKCLHVLRNQFSALKPADISNANATLRESLSATQRWQISINRNYTITVDDPDLALQTTEPRPEAMIQFDEDCRRPGRTRSKRDSEQRPILQPRCQQDLTLKDVAQLAGYSAAVSPLSAATIHG